GAAAHLLRRAHLRGRPHPCGRRHLGVPGGIRAAPGHRARVDGALPRHLGAAGGRAGGQRRQAAAGEARNVAPRGGGVLRAPRRPFGLRAGGVAHRADGGGVLPRAHPHPPARPRACYGVRRKVTCVTSWGWMGTSTLALPTGASARKPVAWIVTSFPVWSPWVIRRVSG